MFHFTVAHLFDIDVVNIFFRADVYIIISSYARLAEALAGFIQGTSSEIVLAPFLSLLIPFVRDKQPY